MRRRSMKRSVPSGTGICTRVAPVQTYTWSATVDVLAKPRGDTVTRDEFNKESLPQNFFSKPDFSSVLRRSRYGFSVP
jgi:hypothetical protein